MDLNSCKKSPILQMGIGFTGYFKVEKFEATSDGSIGKKNFETPWQKNLILNTGLDKVGTRNQLTGSNPGFEDVHYCHVGTGSAEPLAGDVDLQSKVLGHDFVSVESLKHTSESPLYVYQRRTFQFDPAEVNYNLTEFGVGWSDISTNNLFARALFRDEEGNPVTITKLSTEFLRLTYEFRLYPSAETGAHVGSIMFGGTECQVYVFRNFSDAGICTSLYSYRNVKTEGTSSAPPETWPTRSIQNSLSPPSGTAISVTHAAYVDGNYYRDATYSAGFQSHNYNNGIVCLVYSGAGLLVGGRGVYIGFNPPLPKTDLFSFDITLRNSWGRLVTYTVTYDGNGNTGGTPPVDGNEYGTGHPVTVLGPSDLEKTGYVFAGWNTLAGGTGTQYEPAEVFNMGESNVTLYAMWAAA